MAKKAIARRPPPPRPQTPRQRKATATLWAGLIAVFLIAILLPTVMILFFGMMPTIVALIIDRTQQKYASICVGAMNFCGVFPYLMKIWTGTHSINAAADILTNVFALVVMYGTAGFGWMIFSGVPPVIHAFLAVVDQRRVATLRASQRKIIEEWGEAVARPQDGSLVEKADPAAAKARR